MKTIKFIIAILAILSILVCSVCSISAQSYKYGDVDLNGDVDILDATLIQKNIAHLITFTSMQKALADYDHNDEVSIIDCTLIQRTLANLYDPYAIKNEEETIDPDSYRLPVVFED